MVVELVAVVALEVASVGVELIVLKLMLVPWIVLWDSWPWPWLDRIRRNSFSFIFTPWRRMAYRVTMYIRYSSKNNSQKVETI